MSSGRRRQLRNRASEEGQLPEDALSRRDSAMEFSDLVNFSGGQLDSAMELSFTQMPEIRKVDVRQSTGIDMSMIHDPTIPSDSKMDYTAAVGGIISKSKMNQSLLEELVVNHEPSSLAGTPRALIRGALQEMTKAPIGSPVRATGYLGLEAGKEEGGREERKVKMIEETNLYLKEKTRKAILHTTKDRLTRKGVEWKAPVLHEGVHLPFEDPLNRPLSTISMTTFEQGKVPRRKVVRGRGRPKGSTKAKSEVALKAKVNVVPSLPRHRMRRLFEGYLDPRVSTHPDVVDVMEEGCNRFLERLLEDVTSYAEHAGRQHVQKEDLELLLMRQRLIGSHRSFSDVVHAHLPMEMVEKLLPVAQPGNQVSHPEVPLGHSYTGIFRESEIQGLEI